MFTTKTSKKFVKGDADALDLRTTWLINAAEWFRLENRVRWKGLSDPEADLPHVANSLVTLFESLSARRARAEDTKSPPEAAAPDPEEPDSDEWVSTLEPNHFLTHLPKSRKCNTCLQAKMNATPHRRKENQSAHMQSVSSQELP